jgi:hypothetical protein
MVAAAPLIGLAMTAAGGAMQYSAAAAANRASQNAAKQWLQYQKQKQRVQSMKDEQNRRRAEEAQQGTLKTLGDAQGTVDAETQRLDTDLNTDNTMAAAPEATVNDNLLSGQGQDKGFKEYAAKKLFSAAQDARKKTAALAAVQAYTTGQKGLQNTNAQAINEGNQNIDLYNNNRRGDLATYQLAKGIGVAPVPQAQGGIGPVLGQLGGAVAGGALNGLGKGGSGTGGKF